MQLAEVLALPVFHDARLIDSGTADLTREVTLAHVIDVPHAERWVGVQTLLLTTGLSWPRTAAALRAFGNRLASRQPAAVVLAVPGPLRAFPPEVAGPLALEGIPTLTLPYNVPFAAVVQAVHQGILQEQAEVLARSESIHRALTLAALSGGLGDVVDTLSLHLGRSVALIGTEGELLLTAAVKDNRLPAPQVLRRALEQPGPAPRALPGGAGLLTPVLVQGERSAALWIGPASSVHGRLDGHRGDVGGGRHPWPDLVLRSAEHACTVAALLLLARRDLEAREAQLGSALIDTLLEGRFVPEASNLARARTLGFNPDVAYTVCLLDLLEPLPLMQAGILRRDRLAGELHDALKALGTPALMSPGAAHLWFLLPQSATPERLWALLGSVTQHQVGLIYGRPRSGTAGVAQGRAEVLGLSGFTAAGKVTGYTELLVPRAISGDRAAQQDLISSLLDPLREARGGEKLIETLRTLSKEGWTQDRVAALLGIHKNTLRYRMDRAERLTACSLSDQAIRAQWWLVFQLESLRRQEIPDQRLPAS
jgi:purine catabolism regulator